VLLCPHAIADCADFAFARGMRPQGFDRGANILDALVGVEALTVFARGSDLVGIEAKFEAWF
jgi:hypothetical protein